jgi:GntR family transcriptional regulator
MISEQPRDQLARMNVKLPLYAQLKEQIIARISRGDLAPGDQIPSQRLLCEHYGMSHMTVRRAISELLHEGVLYAIAGKGLYVTEPKQDAELFLSGFSEDMARRGMLASSQVLAAEIVGASTVLASALGVEVGTALVHLRRLRLADGEPMAVQSSYLPYALCPGLLKHDLERGSLFGLLRDTYHLRLVDGTMVVEAALADVEQARLLGLRPLAPVLIIEQLTYLDSSQPIEFVRSAYRADRYRLRL